MKSTELSTATLPGQINWTCFTCRKGTRTGGLHIEHSKVRQAERAMAEWEGRQSKEPGAAIDFSELFLMPSLATWRVDCDACRHSCDGCYMIELAQCQTAFALILWTSHLYGKGWFGATNWVGFIANVARVNGSPTEATGVS